MYIYIYIYIYVTAMSAAGFRKFPFWKAGRSPRELPIIAISNSSY